jgi:cyclopropane-fatty-acyl-phospholipid synthase
MYPDEMAGLRKQQFYSLEKICHTRRQRIMGRLKQYNPIDRARRNVAHHYDLSGELYDPFLDKDRQYSCAYFTNKDDDLETAEERKKRHLASKLPLDRPDLKILDIGSGLGGPGL